MPEVDIDAELLFEEKRLRIAEMLEYNKRLDRIILLYITAVYSAIGLKFAEKLDLSKLTSSIDYSYLSFLFIFLNLSIVLHALSQASQAMSLAKFIHMGINKDIIIILKKTNKIIPKYTLEWDNWHTDLRIVAVGTRNTVVALWIVLVIGVSIFSLKIIDVKAFYQNNGIEFWLIIISLSIYLLYIMHNAILLMFYSSKYHTPSHKIQAPKKLLWISSFGATSMILLTATLILLS